MTVTPAESGGGSPYAIIGGSGLTELAGLDIAASHDVDTPYGLPSAPILEGEMAGRQVLFFPRHGQPHRIPPHRVNYRANIHALKQLGVKRAIAVFAVGGISPHTQLGKLVIPDQVIDYSWGREQTFEEGGDEGLMHIGFTEPFDGHLRQALAACAGDAGIPHVSKATYGVTQGPRLETAAEIQRLAGDGCDVVGMTAMPEASLAREAGIAYAGVCMVVNPAAGIGSEELSQALIMEALDREVVSVRALLAAFLTGPHS